MKHNFIYTLLTLTLIMGCSKNTSNTDASETTDSGARGIFGGVAINKTENPAVGIVLIYDRLGKVKSSCTGSLIASNIVLTAAHCFKAFSPNTDSIAFSFDSKPSAKPRLIRVIAVKINPDYRPKTDGATGVYDASADIALVKLEWKVPGIAPLTIAETIPPIPPTGLAARIIGYGDSATGIAEESIEIALPGFGTIPVLKFSLFDLGGGIKRRGDIIFTEMANGNEFFSTPDLKDTNSQRACHGDSGGPALIKINGKYQIAGITSGGFGDYCALITRSFYTNVVKYKAWAEKGIELLNPVKGACAFEDANFHTEDGGCKQIRQQLVWSFVPRNLMTRNQAKSYCDNLVEGDHDDWRLPSVGELQQLAAYGTAHLDIGLNQIPGTLWSNNTAYSVNSYNGRFYPAIYYPNQFVACVRK